MKKFGLLGFPLKHTMSPPIHKRLFELDGLSGGTDYALFEFSAEELPERIGELLSLDGFNVTIPYKVDIMRYIDTLAESAKRYNSVNCVVHRDGRFIGCNTDCDGFLRSIEASGGRLDGKTLLCGCGGVGRMIAVECVRHGAALTVSVPQGFEDTVDGVKKYAAENGFDSSVITVCHPDEISGEFDTLINASPAGMFPNIEGCPVSPQVVKSCGYVFDVVYNPEKTRLLQLAEENNIPCCGGMAMLVWQAAVSHELWLGAKYDNGNIGELIADMHRMMSEMS